MKMEDFKAEIVIKHSVPKNTLKDMKRNPATKKYIIFNESGKFPCSNRNQLFSSKWHAKRHEQKSCKVKIVKKEHTNKQNNEPEIENKELSDSDQEFHRFFDSETESYFSNGSNIDPFKDIRIKLEMELLTAENRNATEMEIIAMKSSTNLGKEVKKKSVKYSCKFCRKTFKYFLKYWRKKKQDFKDYPQDLKDYPQGLKNDPVGLNYDLKDLKNDPQYVKDDPQDFKNDPQDQKAITDNTQVTMNHPENLLDFPQVNMVYPKDLKDTMKNFQNDPTVCNKTKKPYSCQICDKRFRVQSNMKVHEKRCKVHSNRMGKNELQKIVMPQKLLLSESP